MSSRSSSSSDFFPSYDASKHSVPCLRWVMRTELTHSPFLQKFYHAQGLLDVGDLGRKALRDLGDDFLDERLVLHRLPGFHDAEVTAWVSEWEGKGDETNRTMVA